MFQSVGKVGWMYPLGSASFQVVWLGGFRGYLPHLVSKGRVQLPNQPSKPPIKGKLILGLRMAQEGPRPNEVPP